MMHPQSIDTRTVTVERDLAHPPEKVWRALTQPLLIDEWLMKNDFESTVDRAFTLRADWGEVNCRVLTVEPITTLAYTWAAYGLDTIVTWTLTPTGAGTRLRIEQSGFRPDDDQAYHGAQAGWPHFLTNLAGILGRAD